VTESTLQITLSPLVQWLHCLDTPMKRLSLMGCVLGASLVGACAPDVADDEAGAAAHLSEDESPLGKIRQAVKDVDEEHVVFAEDLAAPSESPAAGVRADGVSLSGVDWYQKWAGGKTADHEWSIGSAYGQRCLWASVARFEAIMKDPPPELAAFVAEYTKWGGGFESRNDDYGGKGPGGQPAYGDARGARLWAWRTGQSKWISATAKDGSCYLPTREMLVAFVSACEEHIASNGGEMQGCEATGD
jgi:hypothetical protein